jgi:antitoxin component YwqK of YwqJK toxin-antitoxin module
MKYIISYALILLSFTMLSAQGAYNGLDTLKTYDVNLDEQMTTWGRKYFANGKEVTKDQYMMYKEHWDISQKCTPCILSTYDHQDRIKHVAVQFAECMVGDYTEYHSNGQLKATGQFRQNPSTDWSNLRMRNLCSVRDGKWTYYNANGKAEWVEYYENGSLLKKEQYESAETNKPDAINKLKGLFKKTEQGGN